MTVCDIHTYYICVGCMLYRVLVWLYDPSRTSTTYYVPQRSYVAVQDCPAMYIRNFKFGHGVRGQSWTVRMSVMVHGITSQSSRGNILLPAQTVLPVSNAYTVPLHVRSAAQSENVGISRRADFYVDTYSRWGRV